MDTFPSTTMTLTDLLNQDIVARKRARDREYQRKRRAARRAKREIERAVESPTTCRSCGRPLPTGDTFKQYHPGETAAVSEPCCPYCQNMAWRTRLWWMVKTQRFKLPEA